MKERPIIFSTPMVKAILNGRKSQTRRIINPRTPEAIALMINLEAGVDIERCKNELIRCFCPYGQKGDILYVREAFNQEFFTVDHTFRQDCINRYKADDGNPINYKWKPSIHMPKRTARIWLHLTDQPYPQRLRDISYNDAHSEGIYYAKSAIGNCYWDYINGGCNILTTAYHSFKSLFKSIHGAEIWDKNPWVWVLKFKVLSTTGKPEMRKVEKA